MRTRVNECWHIVASMESQKQAFDIIAAGKQFTNGSADGTGEPAAWKSAVDDPTEALASKARVKKS